MVQIPDPSAGLRTRSHEPGWVDVLEIGLETPYFLI